MMNDHFSFSDLMVAGLGCYFYGIGEFIPATILAAGFVVALVVKFWPSNEKAI